MSDDVADLLVRMIPGILIAIIAAALSSWWAARWAFQRFKWEHWYRHRYDAYVSVLEALSTCISDDLKVEADYYREAKTGGGSSTDKDEGHRAKVQAALENLEKHRHLATLFLSQRASRALATLHDSVQEAGGREQDFMGYLYECLAAEKTCLKVIREEACKDLGG